MPSKEKIMIDLKKHDIPKLEKDHFIKPVFQTVSNLSLNTWIKKSPHKILKQKGMKIISSEQN